MEASGGTVSQPAGIKIWESLVELLHEKLQYGIIDQARSVVDAKLERGELYLTVTSEEALEFFSRDVNQQRLILISRPICNIEKISVAKVSATPI